MKRVLVALAPVAVVLGLVGCMGADDDDAPSSTEGATPPTVSEDTLDLDVTIPDITIPDISIPDISIPDITFPDISIPDISFPDFSIPDISLPDLSELTLPDNAGELFAEAFPNLDQEQLDCLVENLQGNFDPQDAMNLMETCNINPSDLIGG